MSSRTVLAAACVLSCLAAGAGCSGPDFGPDPDFAAIEQRFSTPNGTLNEKNTASLFKRYAENRKSKSVADASGASGIAASSTGTPTSTTSSSTSPASSSTTGAPLGLRALKLLDHGTSGAASTPAIRCDDLQSGDTSGSCDCPEGGSFDYDFDDIDELKESRGPVDIRLRTRFNECGMAGASFDGRHWVRLQTRRGLGGTGDLGLVLTIVGDFRITMNGQTRAIDLVARMSEGELEMALSVDDGFVTVRGATSSGDSGTFVVRDRNGTSDCHVVDGHGICANAKGETRIF